MSIWTPPKFGNVPFGPELTRGLVGYWPLDDMGGKAYDRSGSGNHGTIINAVSAISTRGRCLSFDGTGDYVDVGQTFETYWNSDFDRTVSVWVKSNVDSYVDNLFLFTTHLTIGFTDFGVGIRSNLWAGIYRKTDGGFQSLSSGVAPVNGEWTFVTFVQNGSSVQIYVNGAIKNSNIDAANGTYSSPANALIGAWYNNGDPASSAIFNGLIDEVMIFNRALSAQEVQQLYLYGLHKHRDLIELWTAANLAAIAHTVTINDGIGTTDSFGKAVAKALSDSLGITDSITKVSVYLRSIDDAVGLTDATLKAIAKSVADDLGITDATSKSITKSIADDLGITDDMLRAWAAKIVVADDIGISDTTTKDTTKSIADDLGITDTTTKDTTKSVADDLGIADSMSRIWAAKRVIADDLGITDDLSRGFNRLITDDLGITDDMLRAWAAQKIIADDLGITDSTAKDITKPLVDGIGITDFKTDGVGKNVADDIGITDDMLRVWEILRVISDTLGLTDLISTGEINNYITNIADSIGITDDINTVMAFIRSVSDSVGISDSLSRGFGRSVTETIGITDTQTKDIQKSIAEDLALTDAISRIFAKLLTINDDIGMSDSVSVISGLIKAAVAFLMLKKHR